MAPATIARVVSMRRRAASPRVRLRSTLAAAVAKRLPQDTGRSRQQGFLPAIIPEPGPLLPFPARSGRKCDGSGIFWVSQPARSHARSELIPRLYGRWYGGEERRAAGSKRIRPFRPHHSNASATPSEARIAPTTSANAMNPFMAASCNAPVWLSPRRAKSTRRGPGLGEGRAKELQIAERLLRRHKVQARGRRHRC
jgi:hypothetical protein